MRRKSKISIPAKYTLVILTLLCVVVMFLSFTLNFKDNVLNTVAGYVFVPMQQGINSVGRWVTDKADNLKTLQTVLKENGELKAQVDQLNTELSTMKLEQYDEDELQQLVEIGKKYSDYNKLAASVIAIDGGNWFSTFTINKGKKDGVEKEMNVIASGGLVGIVIDVGTNWAKVRTIIDDTSNVSCITLSTSDRFIVSGNLQSMNNDGVIQFSNLNNKDDKIKAGEQIVTSHISDKYLSGFLVGTIRTIEKDSNNLTCSGTIVPAVDFEHLKYVWIVLEKKEQLEK